MVPLSLTQESVIQIIQALGSLQITHLHFASHNSHRNFSYFDFAALLLLADFALQNFPKSVGIYQDFNYNGNLAYCGRSDWIVVVGLLPCTLV